ncbi:hypothetical protein BC628DRAFT_1415080 [Trametes gibbosa]|nr:hypothetical protein BC628DRAFT_1415080 [Trametes gibbosa]
MASFHRPLHPVHVNTSSYSSLTGAVPRPSQRRSVPTGALTPSPGRQLLRLDHTTVRFDSVASGYGMERGIAFEDIKARNFARLAHPDAQVLQGLGQATLDFRIMWPGYMHLDWRCHFSVYDKGKYVTRAQLALMIVEAYGRFFERARHAHYAGPGGENGSWNLPKDPRQYQLVLRSISNLHGHDAVFQADVDIVTFI